MAAQSDVEAELAALSKEIQEVKTTLLETPQTAASIIPVWWTNTNAMTISSVILIFGLLVFSFATYLLHSGRDGEVILRLFGTIMIVVLAVFLVVAGYTDTQIAPVIGLLGTIAGYLLGKSAPDTGRPVSGSESSDRTRIG